MPFTPWKAISENNYSGVAPGTLCRIYRDPDYEPRRADLRRALGLPELVVAPSCPHCGAPPHPHRNCPARANGKGKPHLPGVSLSDNPAVTARSIRRHKGSEYIRAMWEHERALAWALGETGLLWE